MPRALWIPRQLGARARVVRHAADIAVTLGACACPTSEAMQSDNTKVDMIPRAQCSNSIVQSASQSRPIFLRALDGPVLLRAHWAVPLVRRGRARRQPHAGIVEHSILQVGSSQATISPYDIPPQRQYVSSATVALSPPPTAPCRAAPPPTAPPQAATWACAPIALFAARCACAAAKANGGATGAASAPPAATAAPPPAAAGLAPYSASIDTM